MENCFSGLTERLVVEGDELATSVPELVGEEVGGVDPGGGSYYNLVMIPVIYNREGTNKVIYNPGGTIENVVLKLHRKAHLR